MSKRDYYEVLGIDRSVAEADIKKAYRKIAFEHHPDRNPGDTGAEAKFKEATEAYEVLRDSDQRAKYDQFGHAAVGGGGGAAGYDVSGFDLADALRAFMRDFGGGGGGGGDFGGFEELFGGGGGRRGGRARVRRGNDLQVRLPLTLEEVATGVEKKIRVKHLRACETCKGKGGEGESTCEQCQGRGQVRRVQQSVFGQFVNVATCPICNGDGRMVKVPCKDCGGDGLVSKTETISVKVPAGVAHGNFIRLESMGDAGPRSGPAGDLVVMLEEKQHELFERHDNNLHIDLPISFPLAALGGEVEVPLLGSAKALLRIPHGTQSGQVMRMRGKGLPSLHGGHGDLMVRIAVWVPERLSGADKKAMEAVRDAESFQPPNPGKSFFDRVKDAFAG